MSANDDFSLREIPEQAETARTERRVIAPDVTPVGRGYQNLFRAVCLHTQKASADPG